ncbi:unnamed protein product [Adineta steineri]|uniref:G-protein coupled receptors family 1 profile domain-containing protein n=1 Tax=Adineta steineri TaxID=433720 RepID=A0A814PWI8_9BILA|nr:unnamed protein product [Adineta steineri]CAF1111368.1 unnamed protein product [Adineta steineri]
MAILSPSTVFGQIRDLTSTITNLLTLLISLSFLCIVLYKFFHFNSLQRKKFFQETSILLSLNTLFILIIRSILQFIEIDLNTIKRNYLSITEFIDSFQCRFLGYILLSIHNSLYWSFAIKSIYRFTRVIFPYRKWLHQSTTYLYIFIPMDFLLGFLTTFPIFIGFNAIYLLPNEPYCTASYMKLASLIYMPIVAFVLPLSIISICYMSIILKMRGITTIAYQQRNRRDFIVIQRIIIIIVILSIVSLPLFIDLFVYLPKGYIDPNMNSIGWVASSIDAVILAISLPFIDPKMHQLFKNRNIVETQM